MSTDERRRVDVLFAEQAKKIQAEQAAESPEIRNVRNNARARAWGFPEVHLPDAPPSPDQQVVLDALRDAESPVRRPVTPTRHDPPLC